MLAYKHGNISVDTYTLSMAARNRWVHTFIYSYARTDTHNHTYTRFITCNLRTNTTHLHALQDRDKWVEICSKDLKADLEVILFVKLCSKYGLRIFLFVTR
jgi:hypothetical protein